MVETGEIVVLTHPTPTCFSVELIGGAKPALLETRITLQADIGIAVYQVVGSDDHPNVLYAELLEWEPK